MNIRCIVKYEEHINGSNTDDKFNEPFAQFGIRIEEQNVGTNIVLTETHYIIHEFGGINHGFVIGNGTIK